MYQRRINGGVRPNFNKIYCKRSCFDNDNAVLGGEVLATDSHCAGLLCGLDGFRLLDLYCLFDAFAVICNTHLDTKKTSKETVMNFWHGHIDVYL